MRHRTALKRFALKKFWPPFLFLLCLAGCEESGQPTRSYILTTASTGGTYYPVGVGISTLVKLKLADEHNISLSAINSAGSGENIKLLRSGEAQFALVQGLYGVWARTGQGAYGRFGPQLNLRSMTMLWPNVEHFVLHRDHVKTGTLADLKTLAGAKFAVGNRNSGASQSTRMIFEQLGIKEGEDLSFAWLSYGAAADALQNGAIAGMSTPAGAPVSAVSRAFAAMGDDLVILEITDSQLAAINQGTDLWQRYEVAKGVYPGLETPVRTAAQPNFLAVNREIDEETVYQITRTIFENLPFLYSVHKATRVMSLEHSLGGLPVPLHPGALRYYREVGVEVPARLVPPEETGAESGEKAGDG